ncbi:MAG: hypothetical protein LBQ49_01225 [Rickettsiales bacterium]|jgi:hypothetical protein|nr:hypothetical protein [Rickettsiales bacterium]
MKKILITFFILNSSFFIALARADWCHVQEGGGVEYCNDPPNSWIQCENLNGEPIWVKPGTCGQGAKSLGGRNDASNALIYVGVGVGVVAIAWYFFKAPQSQLSPGQIRLAAF